MKIGIVVDGVLIDKASFMYKNGINFFRNDNHFRNEHAYSFREMFNCSSTEEEKFYKKNKRQYYMYASCEKGASDFTKKLIENGNQIYLMVNRRNIKDNSVTGDINRLLLSLWLKNNGILYNDIIYFDSDFYSDENCEIIKDLKLDYIIEDKIRDSINLSKFCKVIMFDRPYNLGFSKVRRVNSFSEILDILKMNSRSMGDKKMNKVFFKLYYSPKIVNASNIPKEGPVILCGNHLDKLDPYLVNCALKRKVVWYNNDNLGEVENHLSNSGVVGLFPERVINIYRLSQLKIMCLEQEIKKINSNKHIRGTECMTEVAHLKALINLELENIKIIKKQLKIMGVNVVDYDVVLPFDDLAIKLSKEFHAPIVPFSITGDYGFLSNNLKLGFGEPVIDGDNDKVRKSVKRLIYRNY